MKFNVAAFSAASLTALASAWCPNYACAAATVSAQEILQANPILLNGKLANGLRYTILNRPPGGKEFIQLYIEAGSRDEEEGALGVAHFLEHMAFIGPKSFSDEPIAAQFSRAGIVWGRDQNASTTYFGTTYSLGLAPVSDDKISLGFKWLGDVASGLTFNQEAIDRERGVVLQEYIQGLGPSQELAAKLSQFALPNLRATSRPPIGTVASIKSIDANKLSTFYNQWYRPEAAIVVAVGDQPVDDIKRRIEETFGSWKSQTVPKSRYDAGHIDLNRPLDVLTVNAPNLPTAVEVCRYSIIKPTSAEQPSRALTRLEDEVWEAVFARRFQAIARSPKAPFLSATIRWSVAYRGFGQICASALANGDEWKDALLSLNGQIRRILSEGIDRTEFDQVKAQIAYSLDRAVTREQTLEPSAIASDILLKYDAGELNQSAADNRRLTLDTLAKLDPAIVSEDFRHRWNDSSSPLIIVTTLGKITDRSVRDAWRSAETTPLQLGRANSLPTQWFYQDFGTPGEVTNREEIANPGFVRLHFKNGVVVNFKESNFEENQILIKVRFGSGQEELPPGQLWNAQFGANWLLEGGLGKNSPQDISDMCKMHACNAALSIGRTYFELAGSTRREDLRLELQLLAALVNDPGFRETQDGRLSSAVHAVFRQFESNPEMVASLALLRALPEPHVMDVPPEEDAANLTMASFRHLLMGPLVDDALEITIVGDVDEGQLINFLSSTFGALKTRPRIDHTRPDAAHRIFPTTFQPRILGHHSGPGDQAVVILTWPLPTWSQISTRDWWSLDLLTRRMRDEITNEVRKNLGQTYAPSVVLSTRPGGDQGQLAVSIKTSPENVESVISEVKSIVSAVISTGVTPDQLTALKASATDPNRDKRNSNGWWLTVLDGSFQHPELLRNTLSRDDDINSIDVKDFNAEARERLAGEPIVAVSVPKPAR